MFEQYVFGGVVEYFFEVGLGCVDWVLGDVVVCLGEVVQWVFQVFYVGQVVGFGYVYVVEEQCIGD